MSVSSFLRLTLHNSKAVRKFRPTCGYSMFCQPNRLASKKMAPTMLSEGLDVEIVKSGERGKIISSGGGGWYNVQIYNDSCPDGKIMKVRTTGIKTIDEHSSTTGLHPKSKILSKPEEASIEKPPLVYELQPYTAPKLHQSTEKWIIFSDLHVKESSIETCEAVLDHIQETATSNGAGVIFLGDFWHVRGSLSVDLLNRVLRCLKKWTQPVIFIPGNHDQVSLGGAVHALEPLQYALPPNQVMMLSEPVICLGALWIPYRRDHELMKAILKAGSNHVDVSAIFCHADVRGAFMNDGMRSREGIDITDFPKNLPIFSGHFHKPHTIVKGGSSLRYIGSPYQTSLSEAGQTKFIYCVTNSNNVWKEEKRWPFEIGRKYFKASSFRDPLLSQVSSGDRVVVSADAGEDYHDIAASLRERGVEVDIRPRADSHRLGLGEGDGVSAADSSSGGSSNSDGAIGAISEADIQQDTSPLTVFYAYMNTSSTYVGNINNNINNNNSTAISKSMQLPLQGNETTTTSASEAVVDDEVDTKERLRHAVLLEGKAVLERLCDSVKSQSKRPNGMGDGAVNLRIENISLQDFGPYGGKAPVDYPIAKRGLVLIRGRSSDGTGADSNGAGKTTLAMSTMWALTGSLDARLVTDGRAADVAYDPGKGPKRTASVTLTGTVNGEAFEVIRRRGAAGKKSELLFRVGGQDLTTQSVKDTQAVMDATLGIGGDLLQRCSFFGQHSSTLQALLGLTDVKFKNELSSLVNTDLWTAAQSDVRTRERAEEDILKETAVELRVREDEMNRGIQLLTSIEDEVQKISNELNQTRSKAEANLKESRGKVNDKFGYETSVSLSRSLQTLQDAYQRCLKEKIDPLKKQLMETVELKNSQLSEIGRKVSLVRDELSSQKGLLTAATTTYNGVNHRIKTLDSLLKTSSNSSIAAKSKFETALSAAYKTTETGTTETETGTGTGTGVESQLPVLLQRRPLTTEALDSIRILSENSLSDYLAVKNKFETVSLSLDSLLKGYQKPSSSPSCESSHADSSVSSSFGTTAGAAASCPTCGQSLGEEAKIQREKELSQQKITLKRQQENKKKHSDNWNAVQSLANKYFSSQSETNSLNDRMNELRVEANKEQSTMNDKQTVVSKIEKELNSSTKEYMTIELKFASQEKVLATDLKSAENKSVEMQSEIEERRIQLQELREAEAEVSTEHGALNATLAGLEATLNFTSANAARQRGTRTRMDELNE
eukprot:gene110-158_t